MQISSKYHLFKNLNELCNVTAVWNNGKELKLNVFSVVPLTFALDRDEDIFEQRFKVFVHQFKKMASAGNKGKNSKSKPQEQSKNKSAIENLQKNKHFQNRHKNYFLNAKKELTKKYLKSKSEIDYQMVRLPKSLMGSKNVWLIKPSGYNRGFGVELFDSLGELKTHMVNLLSGYQEKLQNDREEITRSKKHIKSRKFVIQKYIERPLLYKQKKFDMRWVAVLCVWSVLGLFPMFVSANEDKM